MESLEHDMLCLLESLHCLNDDKNQQIQALEHLAEMCLQDQGDIIFNKVNGISVVSKFVFAKKNSVPVIVVQKALVTLGNAVLKYDESKKLLCTDQALQIIYSRMLNDERNEKMIASIAYYLSCLCSNSEKAQNKVRKSRCLEKFALLYRFYHPKGNTTTTLNAAEEWFDKASSHSPTILNHISHALKSMMNKPRNGENQIACSRLLNLALSTLNSSWNVESKVEALQFISDCVYENEKSLSIFSMIGGVRFLSQLLEKHVNIKNFDDENFKAWMVYLNAILDTVNVVVSAHEWRTNEENTCASFIDSMLSCLRNKQLQSVHIKCLICLSEMVNESESCQERLVSTNGIVDIINFMSINQDDITSKVGTSILQNCVKTLEDLDTSVCNKNEQKKDDSRDNEQENFTTSDENTKYQNVNENSEILQKILRVLENNQVTTPTEQKSNRLNLRRAKRVLNIPNQSNNVTKNNKSNNINNNGRNSSDKKVRQQNQEMMQMLKSQHDLLERFQEDITSLRAEVRSQPRSTCSDRAMSIEFSSPSKQTRSNMTPSQRKYSMRCPGTEPKKRKQTRHEMLTYTPQQHNNQTKYMKRHVHGEEFAALAKHTSATGLIREEQLNDERPALLKHTTEMNADFSQDRDSLYSISGQPSFNVPSVYEKVKNWQETSLNLPPEIDHDGFQVPTRTQFPCKPNKRPLSYNGSSLMHYMKQNPTYETPLNGQTTEINLLVNCVPRKHDPTDRRRLIVGPKPCLTESTPASKLLNDQHTRRSLNFEELNTTCKRNDPTAVHKNVPFEIWNEHSGDNESTVALCQEDNNVVQEMRQAAHDVRQSVHNVCLGCRPSIRHLTSRNVVKVMLQEKHTCEYHLGWVNKIKEKLTFQRKKVKNDVFRTPKKLNKNDEMNVVVPIHRLRYGTRDLDNMSVFSFRSSDTALHSVCSESTRYTSKTSASGVRRRRKDYSDEEVRYLLNGVERYGHRWTLILTAYPFQNGRQATDLKDKYKHLRKKEVKPGRLPVPFTTQELVNLKLGVDNHGEEWSDILSAYSFESMRTPRELKDKWDLLINQ